MDKLKWYGWLLFNEITNFVPHTHFTTVGRNVTPDNPDGELHFVIWRRWFRHNYQVTEFPVGGQS